MNMNDQSLHELHQGAVSLVKQDSNKQAMLDIRITEPGRYIFEFVKEAQRISWEYLIESVPFFAKKKISKEMEKLNVLKVSDEEDLDMDIALFEEPAAG